MNSFRTDALASRANDELTLVFLFESHELHDRSRWRVGKVDHLR